MKILGKIIPLFLTAAVFASCSSRISKPTVNPTDVMETSMSFARTEMVATLTAAPTSTTSLETLIALSATPIPPTQTPFALIPFDPHDPESVVRAYFDAWNRNDSATRDALAHRNMTYGPPVEYVRILEIKNVSPSPTQSVYTVVFEAKIAGQEARKLRQRFHLSWDAQGDTWYISNLGSY